MSGDRLTHRSPADLLDRVACSSETRAAGRRAFGVPLAEHELDTAARLRSAAVYPIRFAACKTGPCDQGRKLCPSPEACQLDTAAAAGARPPRPRGDTLRTFALAAAGVAGIGLVLGAVAAAALAAAGVLLP